MLANFLTTQIEEQIEGLYHAIQQRINELEPGKLRAYNELLSRQKELQDRVMHGEHRLNDVNMQIRHYEADDKSNVLRKEFLSLERSCLALRKDAQAVNDELEIANLEPKEAHSRFVARVNEFKTGTKTMEERVKLVREEIANARRTLQDLESSSVEEDSGEAAKYELLVKRDQDMTAFIDSFDETRRGDSAGAGAGMQTIYCCWSV